jgi:hypothetical protein
MGTLSAMIKLLRQVGVRSGRKLVHDPGAAAKVRSQKSTFHTTPKKKKRLDIYGQVKTMQRRGDSVPDWMHKIKKVDESTNKVYRKLPRVQNDLTSKVNDAQRRIKAIRAKRKAQLKELSRKAPIMSYNQFRGR